MLLDYAELYLYCVEPEDPSADPSTYQGRWRKIKWNPLSRAEAMNNRKVTDLIKKVY